MRLQLLCTVFLLVFTTDVALAKSYRADAAIGYSDYSNDTNELEMETLNVSGKYYFSPVETHHHPLAEAAFLEKASNIGITHQQTRSEYTSSFYSYSYRSESTDKTGAIDISLYILDSLFYINYGISDAEANQEIEYLVYGETETSTKFFETSWRGSFGIAPIAGLLVWSDFYEDIDLDEYWSLNTKYVMDWRGKGLNLEANFDKYINFFTVSLASDFYFDRTFSLGVGYRFDTGEYSDNGDLDAYMLRGRKFFYEKFSVSAEHAKSDGISSFTLGANVRF